MAVVEITPTRLCDCWALAAQMRPADVAEVTAAGHPPAAGVIESWAASEECWTVRVNGQIMAVAGLAAHPQGTLLTPLWSAWALTSPAVDRFPITFVKESRRLVKRWLTIYGGTLFNFVDARYVQALNWVSRLGFEVQEPVPYGPNGMPFCPIFLGGA